MSEQAVIQINTMHATCPVPPSSKIISTVISEMAGQKI